jgi:putative spermidine/putrescine transport system permease protein
VLLAAMVATCVTSLAFFAALGRSRIKMWGAATFDLVMLLPLLLPHAAIALAIWTVLVQWGWLGTYPGLLLAHSILCFPFAYRPMLNAMKQLDLSMEEAALNLGALPLTVFRRVTLPLLRPGIATAFLFSFIISFDEVSVTLFLVGPNVTTLPVRIFTEIQESGTPTVAAISTLLVCATMGFFLLVDRLVGIQPFISADTSQRR